MRGGERDEVVFPGIELGLLDYRDLNLGFGIDGFGVIDLIWGVYEGCWSDSWFLVGVIACYSYCCLWWRLAPEGGARCWWSVS